MRPCPRPPHLLTLALGPVTITPYKERLAWPCLFVKGHSNFSHCSDLSGVECEMARPPAENLDPLGPSSASDVIKRVVLFYERGTSCLLYTSDAADE